MSPSNRRTWPRSASETSIMYYLDRKEPLYSAIIRNSSIDGLYFVGDNALNDGAACHIVFEKSAAAVSCPPDFKLCYATVKWCSPVAESIEGLRQFGIGVQLDGWCRSLDSSEIQKIFYRCDVCENEVISCDVCKIDGPLFLCSKCYRRLQEIPDGPLKESYLRCLLGNII
jgi:hypothetical protein